jgi:hypothetical protein
MANEQRPDQHEVLVLADQAGNYYVLPRSLVDKWGRVPEEQKADIEQLLGSDGAGFSTALTGVSSIDSPMLVGQFIWAPAIVIAN